MNITRFRAKNKYEQRTKGMYNMKKLVLITGIILLACTVTSAVFASPTYAENQSPNTQSSQNPTDSNQQIYIIKECNGKIAVYKKGDFAPFMTTDTMTANLPKSDVLNLKNGIEVTGDAQLQKALEDFCS